MRKLNRNRPAHQRTRRGLVLLLGPVIAASLIVATPGASSAVTGTPDVAETDSVDVSSVPHGADLPDVGAESTKSVPLPEVTWPKPEDAVEVPVTGQIPPDADLQQPQATTDEPENAPETISVEPVGKLPDNSKAGLGAAYRITTVAPEEAADPETPDAPELTEPPAPLTEDLMDPARFTTAFASGLFGQVEDEPTPTPTEPTPTAEPETPEPTDPPTDPTPTEPGEEPVPVEAPYTSDVNVQLSYADFAGASGGDWSSRLQAVLLTDCVIDTLDCETVTPLKSVNDTEQQTISVAVPADVYAEQSEQPEQVPGAELGATPPAFAPAVNVTPTATTPGSSAVALTGGASGSTGSFAASPLSLSSSWQAGGNTGEFNWSYPLGMATANPGPNPNLGLSYSSGAVDGRTASSNNQASRIGEGFDLDPGFIERSYVPCKDDKSGSDNAPADSTDLCWSERNLTLSLGGKSSRLVMDSDSKHWRLLSDDGTNIYQVDSGTNPDSPHQEEHWVAVTPDGTRYYFGRNKRFDTDDRPTDSVSTVRVYGNHSGEPGHKYAFEDSYTIQGWRWSLDYVVDPNNNTMSLYYDQEENRYGAEDDTVRSLYSRGVRLEHIEYGNTTARDIAKKAAPYRVEFEQDGRCMNPVNGTCSITNLDADSAPQWPDVPYDQLCYEGNAHCPSAPTFFTLYRTSKITSLVRNFSDNGYLTAQTWSLDHFFPRAGDRTSRTLWLSRIYHSSGDVNHPTTSFSGTQLDNRVDTTGDGVAPFVKWRIAAIRNGTGGVVSVNYNTQASSHACSWNDKPSEGAPYSNNKLCYESSREPDPDVGPQVEFFHKYVVDSVVESDEVGNSPSVVTKYTYKGGVAWHYDESNLVPFKNRTWNDWRGFAKVVTEVGGAGSRTWSESLYMRGMDGDRGPKINGNVTYKDVTITDTMDSGEQISPPIQDTRGTAGFVRRTRTSLTGGSTQIGKTINTPWLSSPTATQEQYSARYLRTSAVDTTTTVAGGDDLVTHTGTTFDGAGRPVRVFDDADVSKDTDDRCTETTYPAISGPSIATQIATQLTHAGNCDAPINSDDDVVSSVRNYYDEQALGATLTRRNLSKVETAKGWDNSWGTDAEIDYDDAGRVTSIKNADGKTTAAAYTVGADNIVTNVVTTNPLGQTSSSMPHRKWGIPTQTTDAAGHTTTYDIDYAGRVEGVWTPGRTTSQTPNYAFEYVTASTGSHVATSVLNANGGTTTSRVFYDGLMRERQTQAPAAGPDGGRLITEKRYDSRGWLESKRGPYFNDGDIGTALVSAPASSIPSYTDYTYDRAGRATAEALMSLGKQKSRTKTTYGGTSVSVTPPQGGTPTVTTSDARGQTVSLKQYNSAEVAGEPYTDTTYTYTPAGKLKTVKAAGSTWTYDYDVRGNQTSADDPDKGTTTTTYDDLNRPVTTQDANGTLWTGYDVLGRKTELRDTDNDGRLRASWTYDTEQVGKLSSSTRYEPNPDGDPFEYTQSVTGYDDAGRPTGSKLMLPNTTELTGLYKAGGYVSQMSYYDNGAPKRVIQPSTDGTGVTNEPLNYTYDNLGNVDTLTGAGALVAGTTYTPVGQVAQRVLGPTIGKSVYDTREYDDATARLTRQAVSLQTSATTTQLDQRYGYDEAGNVTSLDDVPTAAGATTLRQCFDYDNLLRMTQAWSTGSTDCTKPTDASPNLGTQTPYWDTYTFDTSGNRRTWQQVRGTDKTDHVSTYPAPADPRPHAVTSVESTAGADLQTETETLTYDATGNTKERVGGEIDQDITWDEEGHQKSVKDKSTEEATSYVYDADGNRLLKKDQADDSTTLYVGNSEYKITGVANTKSLVRTYSVGDGPVATRTANGLTVMIADRNNTGQLAIDGASLALERRRFTPFGEVLDEPEGAWPNEHGYLDKTKDKSTGTTHLGAREYDPRLGRFLSVDPAIDTADPQQMNGYSYADNSPVTLSDPSGLFIPCEGQRCAQKGGGGVYQPERPEWNQQANENLLSSVGDTAFSLLQFLQPDPPAPERKEANGLVNFAAGFGRAAAGAMEESLGGFAFEAFAGESLSDGYEGLAEDQGVALDSGSFTWGKRSGDVCLVVCTLGVGASGSLLRGGVKGGAGLGERLFVSRSLGVDSKLFGHSWARGTPGLLNRPGSRLKVGWSTSGQFGGGYHLRIGIGKMPGKPNVGRVHIIRPFRFSHVPNDIGNPLVQGIRAARGLF